MTTFGPDPIFDKYPHLGWEVGPSDAEKVYFVFSRREAEPIDWQGGIDLVSDRIPGSNRTLYMDMGAQPLRLETRLIFPNKAAFRKFWRLSRTPGLLRMNAAYTVWPGRTPNPVRIAGRDYVEFPDTIVTELPTEATPDLKGGVHCAVTFERRDDTWL